MNYFKKYKNTVLIFISLILLNTTLFASSMAINEEGRVKSDYINTLASQETILPESEISEHGDVPLDSFGSVSVILMLILTSVLGSYFVKDEFSGILK